MPIKKIISGGQTGVDRAALDVGLKLHIPIGGYCPKGRKAEDGKIDLKYPLIETPTGEYAERTLKNVQEADGTLILYIEELSGGTALTKNFAVKEKKPFFLVDLTKGSSGLKDWILQNKISVLNVAGPRESGHLGIYQMAFEFLEKNLS
jgi:hypothetical protein